VTTADDSLEASPELEADSIGLITIAETSPGQSVEPSGSRGGLQKEFNNGRADSKKVGE
jgi:hypothetical protein